MKIIIAFPTLNSLGGAERVCVFLIKALSKNYAVTLATLDRTNWTLLERAFNETSRPDDEFYLLSRVPEIPTLTLRQAFIALSFAFELFLLTLRHRRELLMNMGGEITDAIGDVVYINALPLKLMYVYPQIQPKLGAQWKCYSKLYDLFTRLLKGQNNVILANSKFNQNIIRKDLGKNALAVYPPVALHGIKAIPKNANRENTVVTISRFRSAKGLLIIPDIAAHMRDCKFILIGITDKNSDECIQNLRKKMKELHVENRMEIFTNESFSFILKKLTLAKVFLHTQAFEAFGMSVVEAMAAGCVPVVPRDGGPWFDILEEKEGEYGFSYTSTSEAAQKIRMLLDNEKLRVQVSARASRRASDFDSSVFESRISSIVERAYLNKSARSSRF